MAKPDVPKNVEYQMTDILIQLVDESQVLPTEAVDAITAQFLRAYATHANAKGKGKKSKDPQQKTLTEYVLPPAYKMAQAICNGCSDKMSRYISQYFSEVIIDSSPSGGKSREARSSLSPEPGSDNEEEQNEGDLKELEKAHMLVKELWKACPDVLQNVIPQLEQELMAENQDLRELSVETIGEMALSGPAFSSKYPGAWQSWIGRVNDKSPAVRATWVENAVRVMEERADNMSTSVVSHVAAKLLDADERVRIAAIRALGQLDYSAISSKLSSENPTLHPHHAHSNGDKATKEAGHQVLANLADRVKDRKHAVRVEGIQTLARMWDMAYEDISTGNELAIKQLGWIPGKIFEALYLNEPALNMVLLEVLFDTLLPIDRPETVTAAATTSTSTPKTRGKEKETDESARDKARVQRFLVLVKHMEPKGKKACLAFIGRQSAFAKIFDSIIQKAEQWNGGIVKEDQLKDGETEASVKARLELLMDHIAPFTVVESKEKTKADLWKWVNANDRRTYTLIRTIMNPDSSFQTVVKTLVCS